MVYNKGTKSKKNNKQTVKEAQNVKDKKKQ